MMQPVSQKDDEPEKTATRTSSSLSTSDGDDGDTNNYRGKKSFSDIDEPVDDNDDDGEDASRRNGTNPITMPMLWSPSGSWWKDMWHFVGPGWFVAIAYVDPGNYQADIQAGATLRYSLLFVIWWTSILSIYVQILCVRLAYHSNMTLAEVTARALNSTWPNSMRYMNWFFAEFATVITDLPEVIGIGIAFHAFFGWPYYVGVVLSLFTTMTFLATLDYGTRVLEGIIFCFLGIMSLSLLLEMSFVQPNATELFQGWWYGIIEVGKRDLSSITGVVGAVVMPHNLYLHTATCQSRPVEKAHVEKAVFWSSWESVAPIMVSFVVNMAIVSIAAEQVYGKTNADEVGLTDFCSYFSHLKGGCILWGIALLAAGQSSAITTTYTGQYIMDGFLNLQLLTVSQRAIMTRLIAITPCVIVSVAFPNQLNQLVNSVNSSLSLLLPFAFTPLVKFNCSPEIMGAQHAAQGSEQRLLYAFAAAVWLINAVSFSVKGGGFFGDLRHRISEDDGTVWSSRMMIVVLIELALQAFYAGWNWTVLTAPISDNTGAQHVLMTTTSTITKDDNNVDYNEDNGDKNYAANGNIFMQDPRTIPYMDMMDPEECCLDGNGHFDQTIEMTQRQLPASSSGNAGITRDKKPAVGTT